MECRFPASYGWEKSSTG
ncbi:hypothetical protein AVEN_196667-1, partial [Araneus ventricosus]